MKPDQLKTAEPFDRLLAINPQVLERVQEDMLKNGFDASDCIEELTPSFHQTGDPEPKGQAGPPAVVGEVRQRMCSICRKFKSATAGPRA